MGNGSSWGNSPYCEVSFAGESIKDLSFRWGSSIGSSSGSARNE